MAVREPIFDRLAREAKQAQALKPLRLPKGPALKGEDSRTRTDRKNTRRHR